MGHPFSRLTALNALFQTMLAAKVEDAFWASGLAGYQSRGHGKAKAFTRSHFSNKSKQAGRSKYMPHQGKQEIARRQAQEFREFTRDSSRISRYILRLQENGNG